MLNSAGMDAQFERSCCAISRGILTVYKFNPSESYYYVGLYIGEGKVIEAKGTAYGVVTSKIGSGWTHWGELKGVDYAEKACK